MGKKSTKPNPLPARVRRAPRRRGTRTRLRWIEQAHTVGRKAYFAMYKKPDGGVLSFVISFDPLKPKASRYQAVCQTPEQREIGVGTVLGFYSTFEKARDITEERLERFYPYVKPQPRKNPSPSWVDENMPIRGRRAVLTCDDYMGLLQLQVWDADTLLDIKEDRNIRMLPPGSTMNKRTMAYLTAWRNVVQTILDRHPPDKAEPADFVPKDHPLLLKQAQTVDDFEKALLAKHRLGWMIR